MAGKKFLSIGECMVEFARSEQEYFWARNFAGDTFNTSWYFNALSSSSWSSEYFSCVGDDKISEEMLAFINAAGIETDNVPRLAGKSPGLYTIDLDGAERSFSYWRDSSAARALANNAELLKGVLANANEVYFSGITLAILPVEKRKVLISALSEAKQSGAQISFDPNIRPRLWEDTDSIKYWTHEAANASTRVFPTHDDEADIFSDDDLSATADRYEKLGVREVVVKNGADPCLVSVEGRRSEVIAEQVKNPIDTTGAGDSFNAGYLVARTNGQDASLSCSFAHKLSAKVIACYGALVPKNILSEIMKSRV